MKNNKQFLISKYSAIFIFLTIIIGGALQGEVNIDEPKLVKYEGLWLTEINGEDVYLLIKKDNLAGYIYKELHDNKIYNCSWEVDSNNCLLVSGENFKNMKFKTNLYEQQIKPEDEDFNFSIIKKISTKTLGEWALSPDHVSTLNNFNPTSYFGLWETQLENNPKLIKIYDDRTVLLVEKSGKINIENTLQGVWQKHGDLLHVSWENGNYSLIDNRNKIEVKMYNFASGESISEEASSYDIISKIDNPHNNTHLSESLLINTKQNNISLSQFDYKSLLKFYKGEWIIFDEENPNAIEILKLNRFGSVNLASDRKTKGRWRLSREGCIINLDQGIRMKLNYVGTAFLIFVYEANRPIDGYPNKVLKAVPANKHKLDILKIKAHYSLKLVEKVTKLKSSQNSMPLISNWSGLDTINPAPKSPWWWPIWSDNLKTKENGIFSQNNTSPSLTNQGDSIASIKVPENKTSPNPMEKINESRWVWPF